MTKVSGKVQILLIHYSFYSEGNSASVKKCTYEYIAPPLPSGLYGAIVGT